MPTADELDVTFVALEGGSRGSRRFLCGKELVTLTLGFLGGEAGLTS